MSDSMTRQHFRALADAISGMDGLDSEQRMMVARQIAVAVRRFNSRFDREKFIDAATAGPLIP